MLELEGLVNCVKFSLKHFSNTKFYELMFLFDN